MITNTKQIEIFGITVFQRIKYPLKTIYYFLGIKIFTKKASIKQYLEYKFNELTNNLQGKTTYLDKQITQLKNALAQQPDRK